MRKLNIIGCGRVGKTLGRSWRRHGIFEIGEVFDRTLAKSTTAVEFIGSGRAVAAIDAMQSADAWMLAPPDGSIVQCCADLARAGALKAGVTVFHCSGALAATALAAASRLGAHVASVHPVKSFADPTLAVESFAGTWCGIEGDAAALAALQPAFEAIGGRCFAIAAGSKTIYHAASVIASNYLVALVEAAARCYERAGIDGKTALQVMEPLARETLANAMRLGPSAALTGPIVRGDYEIVSRQLEALNQADPEIADVYRALGVIALDLAKARSRADAAAELEHFTRLFAR